MVFWLATSAFAADCPVPAAPAELGAVLDAAEAGFVSLSSDVFRDRLDEATLMLPCLDDVLAPSLAARWHGLSALRLYTAGRPDDARASFASARAADPAWTLSEALVPPIHDVRSLVEPPAQAAGEVMEPPAEGRLFVDGAEGDARPADRPVIVQWLRADTVGFTSYSWPGDALPPYPRAVRDTAAAIATHQEPTGNEARRRKWGFLVAGGVAAGTSAVLYGLGAAGQQQTLHGTLDAGVDRAELESMQSRTNALVVSSGVTAGLAAAGLVTFVVVQ